MLGTWRHRCEPAARTLSRLWLVLGLAVMAVGLGVLVLGHDEAGGYSLLTVGAVIFGTVGGGRAWRPRTPPNAG